MFRLHGWKHIGKPLPPEIFKCVFVFAPHTSNWDWYFGTLCMVGWGVPIKIAIKNSWVKSPIGWFIKLLGGVGIDRKRGGEKGRLDQVKDLANILKKFDKMAFVITPEGSRAPRDKWKTGFYHIAKLAEVPIVTLVSHAKNKTVELGPVFRTNETLEECMRIMMEFYQRGLGIVPENFVLDKRYI